LIKGPPSFTSGDADSHPPPHKKNKNNLPRVNKATKQRSDYDYKKILYEENE